MSTFIPRADIEQVFEAWRKFRKRPEICRLTTEREGLIRARLQLGYSADDLCRLIRYMNLSGDDDARWMRGHNPRRRTYMDLQHLLRKQRLGERVEAAIAWESDGGRDEATVQDSDPFRLVDPNG